MYFAIFSTTNIKEIIVPTLEQSTQQKIVAFIQESFALKAQNEQLLQTAKHVVEMAIEKDEE